jgi:DNA-directed RNA polymerase subunit RPC12/RpoP
MNSGRRFGFPCVYCSSRLEAWESQSATEGACPTCGSQIVIPILGASGRLIDPRTQEIIKPDPHPVHAYAAAGERAPRIRRRDDGSHAIVCQRCAAPSPITANSCLACGNPFTIEGTTDSGGGQGSGLAAASLVLGIISIPGFCLWVVGPLAIIFGSLALSRSRAGDSGRGSAIAGITCGAIGTLLTILVMAL